MSLETTAPRATYPTPEWLDDPATVRSTLEGLDALGCQTVLLAGFNRKRPKKPARRGWKDARPTVEQCIKHLERGGQLGWIPASLGCVVIDVDGPQGDRPPLTPEQIGKLVQRVRDHMGPDGFVAEFESDSGFRKQSGKRHLIYTYPPESRDAPLGLKADGKPYERNNATRFADDIDSHFDPLWKTYAFATNYLDALLERMQNPPDAHNANLAGLIEFGLSHKPKPKFETASAPPVDAPISEMTEARRAALHKAYWDKQPALTEGSRHDTLRRWGAYAGFVRNWDPESIDEARRRATNAGISKAKIARSLDAAYEWAKDQPAGPLPPDRPNWKRYYADAQVPQQADLRSREQAPVDGLDDCPEAAQGFTPNVLPDTGCIGGSQGDIAALYLNDVRDVLRFNIMNAEDYYLWIEAERIWKKIPKVSIRAAISKFASARRERAVFPKEDKELTYRMSMEGSGFASGVESLVSGESDLHIDPATYFDQNPLVVGLPGGRIFDVCTGASRDARMNDLVTKTIAVVPKRGPANRFMKLLNDCFVDDTNGVQKGPYVMRFLGHMMTGDTSEHKSLFWFGDGGTGKSTLLDICKEIAGDLWRTADHTLLWEEPSGHIDHPQELMQCAGYRAVVIDETGRTGRLRDSVFNKLTTGTPINARNMREDSREFKPLCDVLQVSNFPPRLRDSTTGAARRVRVVRFNNRLSERTMDANRFLKEQILAAEAPAIAYILLSEAHKWYKRRAESEGQRGTGLLPEPQQVKDDTAYYVRLSDPVLMFLEDRTATDPEAKITAASLFAAFKDWAKSNNRPTRLDSAMFGRDLKRLRPNVETKRVGQSKATTYLGIDLLPGESDNQSKFDQC